MNINWNLSNHRLVLVGGCGGIGLELVRQALQNDVAVAVLDLPRSIEENPLPDGVEIVIPVDVIEKMNIVEAFATVGKTWKSFHHLVCLQGFTNSLAPLDQLTVDTWDDVMDVNLRSVWLCCKYALPFLKKSENASIITVSSGIGNLGNAGYGPYSVAKIGLQTLTKTLAKENAPSVRVNCIAPGAVLTPFLGKGTGRGGKQGDAPERVDLQQFIKLVPAGRIAEPDDVVEPILFLMSEAARYITGQTIHVNGGALMPGWRNG
jgi:3-oxoacyl-[acyl-carrier protein] reductase